ncbi:hypothetical protein HNY73_010416 [Argiope bruennichi]|uniref:Uncharacterized protein n=1 Tax=Argiope bruennichi TaxID=94029 RepID=A0A8T0F3C0_ARGBR|nr:hypothetical protein HNY73_010416 [Argiope bruennichi]
MEGKKVRKIFSDFVKESVFYLFWQEIGGSRQTKDSRQVYSVRLESLEGNLPLCDGAESDIYLRSNLDAPRFLWQTLIPPLSRVIISWIWLDMLHQLILEPSSQTTARRYTQNNNIQKNCDREL